MQYAVRGDGTAIGGWEHPGATPHFSSLFFQNAYRIFCQGQGTVGVFRFQGSLHHFPVDAGDLPPYPKVTPFQINILPFQPQQFAPPQACGQFQIVQLKHAAIPDLPEEGGQLHRGQGFHLLVFHPGQGAALRRIGEDQPLLLGQL